MEGFDYCLAHLKSSQLNAALAKLRPGADLDVRGTVINPELLDRILHAVREDGCCGFGYARFDGAEFDGDARFDGAEFKKTVSFAKAHFNGGAFFDTVRFGTAWFDDAHFDGLARFAHAQFTARATFHRAKFGDNAFFNDAEFTNNPYFNNVSFDGDTWFDGAKFRYAAFFGKAQFNRKVRFAGANFNGAMFNEAKFSAEAEFDNVQFDVRAWFSRAEFGADAVFKGAKFNGDATFENTWFDRNANFAGAKFSANALFNNSHFGTKVDLPRFYATTFDKAQFGGKARFIRAKFGGSASFNNTQFSSEALFDGAQVDGDAQFQHAKFDGNGLGTFAAASLDLLESTFSKRSEIRVAAAEISCDGATWLAGLTMQVRYARIQMARVTFAEPSSLSGSYEQLRFTTQDEQTLDDERVRTSIITERSGSTDLWVPSLSSVRATDVAKLSLADIDLAQCSFADARLLDQIQMGGGCSFDHPPSRFQRGRTWPPVWRWSSRQTLAEERIWRITTRKYAGWADNRSMAQAKAGPEQLAVLYRQLRKALEDSKNEPGAADFYYGEMEMRRHAKSTPLAERLVVAAYWAISGYGLRATRAFVVLAVLILASATALKYAGFLRSPHVGFVDSMLYACGSVLSLDLGNVPEVLTHWGDVLRILLRIGGPVCLGLAALALRGRIKR